MPGPTRPDPLTSTPPAQGVRGSSRSWLPAGASRPGGWIARQARQNLDGFLGAMPSISDEVGGDVFAAGRLGPGSGGANVADVAWWNGESEGNWLHGYAAHVRMVGTPVERADVEERLARIVAAADPDGYVGMFAFEVRQGRSWVPGDLWTRSRVLAALAEWGTAEGSGELAAAVQACRREIVQRYPHQRPDAFRPGDPDTLVAGHDLQIVETLLGDPGHSADPDAVAVALAMYADFSAAPLSWPEDDAQLAVLGSDSPFHGHGPHVAENLRIPLLLAEAAYATAGEDDALTERAQALWAAYERGWAKLPAALGVTGAVRSDEAVGHPDSQPWPVPEAGNEYCAITELALTALEHARVTGDPDAVDLAESLWLNAAQAGRAPDGAGVAYFTAANQRAATKELGARWDLSPTHDDAAVCCAPNAGRILPLVVDRAVAARPHGLSVLLYGPMTTTAAIDGAAVTLRQTTAYPFDESVEIAVDGAPEGFVLELRIPGWCEAPQLSSDQAGLTIEQDDARFVVAGRWSRGVRLDLRLPAAVRELTAVDGRRAVAYGPLVLAAPIEPATTVTRQYPNSPLADRDLTAADAAQLYPPYLLEPVLSHASVRRTTADDPWATPTVRAEVMALAANPHQHSLGGAVARPLELVPIGCTQLRWTCFTVLRGASPVPAPGRPGPAARS